MNSIEIVLQKYEISRFTPILCKAYFLIFLRSAFQIVFYASRPVGNQGEGGENLASAQLQAEVEFVPFEYGLYNTVADELGQQMLGGEAREVGHAAVAVQRQKLVLAQQVEQQLFALGVLDEFALRIAALLPHAQVYGRGQYVFVLDAQIGQVLARFVAGVDGFLPAFFYFDHEDTPSFGLVGVHAIVHLRRAIQLCGGLYHILLFVRAYAGYFSVVFHADQQPSAVGVGKC